MSSVDTSERNTAAIISRYRSIGLFGGLILGGLAGVMVAGPHFHEWTAVRASLTVFGSFAVGGLIGYVAGEIAVASLASPHAALHSDEVSDSGGGGGGGGEDGSGGGDS